jgi:hypothetical protein
MWPVGNYLNEGMVFTQENGQWKMKGNGYNSKIELAAETRAYIAVDGTVTPFSGINLKTKDQGNYGLQYLTVTGPGLPAGGVTATKQSLTLWIDSQYQNASMPLGDEDLYVIDDATLQSIPDNALYTFTFYAADGTTVLETRTAAIARRPFLLSELTQSDFATMDLTSHAIATANVGGTLTFPYALPTAYTASNLYADFEYWDNLGNQGDVDITPLLTQTSASIVAPALAGTAAGAALKLEVQDAFWRTQTTTWLYQ